MSRWPADPRTASRPPIVQLNGRLRSGHRREHDDRLARRQFRDRVEGALVDVSVHRAVAFTDVAKAQFGGHPFTARRGVNRLLEDGLVEEHHADGPKGGKFKVLVATKHGARIAKGLVAEHGYGPEQETWSGLGRRKDLRHDVAIYRDVQAARRQLEDQGAEVRRVRLDAEMRRAVARASEAARVRKGRAAADEARWRAAEELGLPVGSDGKVAYPDAQIEYTVETDAGRHAGRVNIETASEHYRAGALQAKAAAGFVVGAANGKAARAMHRAGIGRGGNSGRAASTLGKSDDSGGGRGKDRDPASVEL